MPRAKAACDGFGSKGVMFNKLEGGELDDRHIDSDVFDSSYTSRN